jgi:hypothetical protein
LYEGAVESRYTGISYEQPRKPREADASMSVRASRVLVCCLLADGLATAARLLQHKYGPYLLSTLCLILERVGESLHAHL